MSPGYGKHPVVTLAEKERNPWGVTAKLAFEDVDAFLRGVLLVMGPESSIEGTVVDTEGNGLEGLRVSPTPRPSPIT